MNPLTLLRQKREEDDPLRSAPFSAAEPDAIANPLSTLRRKQLTGGQRQRVRDEMFKDRFAISDIPGASALKSLYAAGKGVHTAAKALLPGSGKAADVAERVAIKPAIPSETVAKVAGYLPGAERESRLLGRLARDVELGIPSLLALNPLVDFGVSPRDIQALQAQAKPTSPAKAIASLNEYVAPTIADIATAGAPMALGMAIRGAGKARKAAKAAKATERLLGAVEASPDIADLSRGKIPLSTKFSKYGGAIEPDEPFDLPPPSPPREFVPDPGRGKFSLAQAKLAKSAEPAIRDAGGMVGVPPEAAEGIASAGRNTIRDTIRGYNTEVVGALEPYLDAVDGIKNKGKRVEAQKKIITLLETGQSTGDQLLDRVGQGIQQWLDDSFYNFAVHVAKEYEPGFSGSIADAIKVAKDHGIDLKKRNLYFPHINEELPKIVDTFNKSNLDGITAFRHHYVKYGEEPPDDAVLGELLKSLTQERLAASQGDMMRSVAPNIERTRDFDIPGYIGDVRGEFKDGDLARALHAYGEQMAFRKADATHFGPQAEKFKGWLEQVQDSDFLTAAKQYRAQIMSATGGDPLQQELAGPLSFIRQWEATSKLGRMGIANAWQNALTAFPKEFHGLTTGQALGNMARSIPLGIKELVAPGEATMQALRAGAVYDRLLADLAGMHRKGPLSGVSNFFIQAGGGPLTERTNNVVGFHLGRWWGEDLSDVIASKKGNDKLRQSAEYEVRKVLETNPNLAEQFVRMAKQGEKPTTEMLDNVGYEFARSVHFRGDPTMVPLDWSTPVGKTIAQFKTFGWNYGRFVKEDVIKYGIRTKDLRPLIAMGAAGLVSGAVIDKTKKLARLNYAIQDIDRIFDEEIEPLQAFEASGISALFGDTVETLRRGSPQGIAGLMLGPAVGDVVEMGVPLARGNVGLAATRAVGNLPLGALARPAEDLARGDEVLGWEPSDTFRSRSSGNPLTNLRMRYRP